MRYPRPVLVSALSLFATVAAAQEPDTIDYDRLWSYGQLYSGGPDAPVENIVLSGRFQVDQPYVDSEGNSYSNTDIRRFRFGFMAQFLENFTLHAEGDFQPTGGNLGYRRLTDAYLAWSPNDALQLKVGKHSAPFTMDGQTSSKRLITIDRNNLTNNIWFTAEYMPGISIGGRKSNMLYHVGIYSSGEQKGGFGDSNGGEFVLATLGRDFSEKLNVREAVLRFNYVDNEPEPNNTFTRPLEQIGSLNFSFDTGQWGLRSDISAARGYLGQSDLRGFMIMPYYNFSEGLQFVMRYTFVESDEENGVRFARYEKEVVAGRGDKYNELYAGLNYYWYGHKLKFQTGLQYADMDDRAADGGAYSGWAWTTGIRVSW